MELKGIMDTRRRGEPDIVLFVAIFILAAVGIIMSYSASAVYAQRVFHDSFYFLKRQLAWFVVGFAALLAAQEIDYRFYLKHTKILLLISLFLLSLVLIPGVGHSVKGSMRWLNLGFLSIQPSEFVKVVMVIYLSKVFSSDTQEHVVKLLIPMVVLAVMFILIMLQPDFGTSMDLLVVSVMVLFVSGFPFLYILMLFLISIPMFYLLIYQVSYRWQRLVAYADPWKNRFGTGYHVVQSFIAFKRGGLLGAGLGNGTQKIQRLPEPHTDFIFAVIAEETGLLGTLSLVALYGLFFWRGILVAVAAPDQFGRLLAMGLSLMVTVQAAINIGVVTGVLPTTGVPLPFVSYGGSSLLSNMIAGGILLNISRYRDVAGREINFSEGVQQ